MHALSRAFVALVLFLSVAAHGADTLSLTHPQPHQVVQRIGVAPGKGYADVKVVGTLPATVLTESQKATWEYRIVILANQPVPQAKTDATVKWMNILSRTTGGRCQRSPEG